MSLINLSRLARRRSQDQGFTLIELVIVIFLLIILVLVLLLAVLPAFANTKGKATESGLTTIGDGLVTLQSQQPYLYFALTGEAKDTYSGTTTATLGLGSGPSSRSDTQLARLLVFVLSPTQAAANASVKDGGGLESETNNALGDQAIKQILNVEHDWANADYPVYVDAWGNPYIYEIDPEHISQDNYPTVRLVSAGEDGDYGTTEDNLYWDTALRKTWKNLANRPE